VKQRIIPGVNRGLTQLSTFLINMSRSKHKTTTGSWVDSCRLCNGINSKSQCDRCFGAGRIPIDCNSEHIYPVPNVTNTSSRSFRQSAIAIIKRAPDDPDCDCRGWSVQWYKCYECEGKGHQVLNCRCVNVQYVIWKASHTKEGTHRERWNGERASIGKGNEIKYWIMNSPDLLSPNWQNEPTPEDGTTREIAITI
jgi:hypothetical protein